MNAQEIAGAITMLLGAIIAVDALDPSYCLFARTSQEAVIQLCLGLILTVVGTLSGIGCVNEAVTAMVCGYSCIIFGIRLLNMIFDLFSDAFEAIQMAK